MSSDNDAAPPPVGGDGGNDTLRIRSSSVPDNSWSSADGQGAGPTRPSPKPAGTTPTPTSTPPGPRPPAPGPGPRPAGGAPRPGPGTASGPAARPATPAPSGGGSRQQGGFGAVSALASPEPVAGRSEQRDKPAAPKAPRKAHLVLRRVEPWSAMKFSFVVSLVCFVVLFVAVAVLYGVLSALGVFDSIVNTVTQLTSPDGKSSAGFDIKTWFEPARILGYTALLGAVNVVLITALSTLGSVIYNVASDLVGGVEVTFSEAE
ncbi:hypothetical protein Sme01_41890 [Sphaerisporangium melleum]|uniref:DUF3566 domain-containing protein n=1 Tax=Sphaerisporangium melleum TaxID=321316 RepID=A0A917VT04_9ACTN|nr:DUF3566 domain-containing protein [Sphaerisporangium melleum]GGL11623.1 hypothetical protein GCM10007964_62140 [Sphaerisporangium melleum]GII71713.1 hypothetical protein Sme01_41890 [Sphaerisporangium melleum]